MSRIPRFQEHLKTGFTAEAVSAARYRAFGERADRDGMPQLAARWRRLAAEKDRLAVRLLVAAGQVAGLAADLGAAVAEERFENDVLYPKMLRDLDQAAADAAGPGVTPAAGTVAGHDAQAAVVFRELLTAQAAHLGELEALRRDLKGAQGDVPAPAPAAGDAAAKLAERPVAAM